MRKWLRHDSRIFLYLSAAAFWTVAATVLALAVLERGGLPSRGQWPSAFRLSQWRQAAGVLGGRLVAVEPAELALLEGARQELEKMAAEPAYRDLREAVKNIEAQRLRQQAQLADEATRLLVWQAHLGQVQQKIDTDIARLEQQRAELAAASAAASGLAVAEADRRILAVYRQLEPAQVAEDLATRFQLGAEGRRAAARLLALLTERQAAEVLAELDDPLMRSQIIDEYRLFIAGGATATATVERGGT